MSELNERVLQRQFLSYLQSRGFKAWLDRQTVGKPGYGTIRSSKGVADILAVVPPMGRFLAIEVKMKKGVLSQEQRDFLSDVRSKGGVGEVVTSLEELQRIVDVLTARTISG
jgi:hypothetical protein